MYLRLLPRLTSPLVTSYSVLQQQVRHAGHNKWSNIRHIKGAKDLETSKVQKNEIIYLLMSLLFCLEKCSVFSKDQHCHQGKWWKHKS